MYAGLANLNIAKINTSGTQFEGMKTLYNQIEIDSHATNQHTRNPASNLPHIEKKKSL